MNKRHLRQLSFTVLALVSLVWGAGSALAYLSPSNPAVLTWDANQTKFMPGSYTADYSATPILNYVIGPGKVPDYLTTPNWAYSPPLRKFIDKLPGLGAASANNLGQYIPVATPDIVTFPGSDYYEIELRQFTERMHSDLPATTLRGYIQVNRGTDTAACTDPSLNQANPCTAANNTKPLDSVPHYLGPIIVAQKDRPVRVKFINKLPAGSGGDLFVPVDQTIMGAGPFEIDYDPVTKEPTAPKTGTFAQNRGELHLHGGRTPWISDGTPHQWITPAGEVTDYPTGVSVENVPDMPDPGPGAQTYYWTNQQSSRMLFFHDHAWGITRLNVYVGEAAGYLIRDAVEQDLITRGIIPAAEIPLVIQDKTYVDPTTIVDTDPTWAWGSQPWTGGAMTPVKGDLWWPHVYMPAQNPFDISGIAPMGRWAYGPYFWPATNNPYQPIPNPYYDPACDPNGDPATTPGLLGGPLGMFCQAPEIPSSPNPSWGAEAFMDTPTVNGTAYPVLNVDPKPYRFRVLNAAHDRFFNLQLYKADPNPPVPVNTPANPPNPASFTASGYGGFAGILATGTEVKMLPALDYSTNPTWPTSWPADGRPGGIPDWTTIGPNWILIGTEGGFLPRPVEVPSHPVTWNADVTTFNAGNVNGGSLILGPAERADVIVDFSQYAGQTLILYNDAPAPWPALDPHYDYYTDAPDNRAMGGADTTPVGFGPNVRTIMQIKVGTTNSATFNLNALKAEFVSASNHAGQQGVFQRSQDPLIAGQGNMNPTGDPVYYEAFPFSGAYAQPYDAMNSAYDRVFPAAWPNWGVARINDKVIYFTGSDGSTTYNYNPADTTPLPWDGTQTTKGGLPMKFKAIQDEQGETFDDFGRMRAALGLELITPGAGRVNFIVQTYSDPATEVLEENGIQVWKITHNGVDTHPVHFHLFDVQVLNRVGWDGFIRLPDPTELGWKDTVRISPLEDTIVALKPVKPAMPFGVPDSYRPLNPATPLGDTTELSLVDPTTGQAWATPNVNRFINLNWEYVWHCHILSHEENDMMRPMQYAPLTTAPDAPTGVAVSTGGVVTWTDTTPAISANFGNPKNEIGFQIQRCSGTCTGTDTFTAVGSALANAVSFADTSAAATTGYSYRVVAYNSAGSTASSIATVTTGNLTPPTVSVTAPANGATVNYGTPILLTANASSGAGIARVEFYVDGVLFSTDTTAPYSYNWTTATPGSHTITAQAHDTNGVMATSAGVGVTVTGLVASVSLASDIASPQLLGATVNFTATATGGYSPEYEFWISRNGGAWSTIQIYSASNTLAWTPTQAGAYSIHVRARSAGSTAAYEAFAYQSYAINVTAVASVTLGSDIASPQLVGATVNFTATATGGVAPVQYEYWVSLNGGAWTAVQAYSTTNTLAWTPAQAGAYVVHVRARSAGSALAYEAFANQNYTVNAPAVASVTLGSDIASPQLVGATVNFTATATGGVSPQYEFWVSRNGGAWSTVQAYSAANTLAWTPAQAGAYTIHVRTRSAGSALAYEAYMNQSYAINVPAVASVTLGSDIASPQLVGATINFTATATGGVAPVQYEFWVSRNGGAWTTVQAYSTTNTLAWTPAQAGAYVVHVRARSAGSALAYEAYANQNYAINVPAVASVTLGSNIASPQLVGATVNFTATATGGVAPVQYEFWVSRNGGAWTTVQAYSTTNTLAWTPAQAGAYVVHVRARSAGSALAYEAYANQNYAINVPAVASVTLGSDVASPQPPGATINFTATATGGVAPVQYEYWVSLNGGTWSTVQAYSTTNTLAWTPAQAGAYVVHVRARSAGSALAYEAYMNQNYTIQ